jgi:hypothetical protein
MLSIAGIGNRTKIGFASRAIWLWGHRIALMVVHAKPPSNSAAWPGRVQAAWAGFVFIDRSQTSEEPFLQALESRDSASALSNRLPSPSQALPCMQASVVGLVATRLSISE